MGRRLVPAEIFTAVPALDGFGSYQFGAVGTVLHLAALNQSLLKYCLIFGDSDRQDKAHRAQQQPKDRPSTPASPLVRSDDGADKTKQKPDNCDWGTDNIRFCWPEHPGQIDWW
jgi:hypothetical protein